MSFTNLNIFLRLLRADWPPDSKEGVERIFTQKDKHVTTQVLPRDKLVGVLNQIIKERYPSVELNYGYEVYPIDFEYRGGTSVLVEIAKCVESGAAARLNPSSVKTSVEDPEAGDDVLCDTDSAVRLATPLLVAADGTVRTFANAMERADKKRRETMKNPLHKMLVGRPFRVKRYVDDNQRVYKTIPVQVPGDWRYDLNYSARSKGGRFNFDALPANDRGTYCGVMLLRKGDPMARADTDPAELRELLDEYLPAFSPLLDDETVAMIAKKPVSYLPGFRYAGPRLHQGNHCLILGDCAHTVKPYFGLGANSALEDVKVLSDILDDNEGDIPRAVREYSRRQAPEAKTMVRLSRDLDRPGKLGLINFIFPLILDSIFNGVAPKLFRMNVIAMMQREQYTFQQVARRKRLDRTVQIAILGGAMYGMYRTALALVRLAARSLGVSASKVMAGVVGSSVALILARRFSGFLAPGLSPGDVLAKMSKRITSSQSWHLTPLRKLMSRTADESDDDSTNDKRDVFSKISVTRLIRPRSTTTVDATNGETFVTLLGNRKKD